MNRVYPSKIDRWLVLVLAFSTLGGALACAPAMVAASGAERVVIVAGVLVAFGLPVWLLSSTYYVLDDDTLHVHSGPFHWRIALRDVTAVTPTRSPLSSPALSLDRLRVDYAGKSLMISPLDQAEFRRDLKDRQARLTFSRP